MAVTLYDLCGGDGRRFSPFCWRTRMALAHKGLEVEAVATKFHEIKDITGDERTRVPVIVDQGIVVEDSFQIALYLEETYPDKPSLFKGEGGVATAAFVDAWANITMIGGVAPLIVKDIHDVTCPSDQAYFRESREKRFGKALEAVQAGREEAVAGYRTSLNPLRYMLKKQAFIGGDTPLYADYIVFGSLQFPRVTSTFAVLAPDDPVKAWFERCLDLHGGLGREMPAAA